MDDNYFLENYDEKILTNNRCSVPYIIITSKITNTDYKFVLNINDIDNICNILNSYYDIVDINFEYFTLLDTLPILPNYIESLNCSYNNIVKITNLPINLKYLNCYKNKLVYIAYLPYNLLTLNICVNLLKYIPKLPIYLKKLNCCNNNILHLPILPYNLVYLCCTENKLIKLIKLNCKKYKFDYDCNDIKYIYCNDTRYIKIKIKIYNNKFI